MVISRYVLRAAALCLVLSACELDEITISQAQPVVVVHGVINVGKPMQFVILEQSLTGRSSLHYSSGLVPPAPAGEGIPIEGAYVALTYLGTGSCAQPTVRLHERPPVELWDVGVVASGTYVTSELCSLSPGDSVDLRVEMPSGDVVLGTTVIPGARSIDIHTRSENGANLVLDRTTDSVWIDVDPLSARALAFELARDRFRTPHEYEDDHYTLTTDTMSMVFAGDLKSFEDEDDGEAVFLPGQYLTLTVAVADTNYYDFVRSFSNPLTGRGFINHVQGGIGVFGSVLTSERSVRVIDNQDDEREGLYRISGTLDSVDVGIILDLYLQPFRRHGEFSAFVDGTWVHGPVSTSADGQYEYAAAAARSGRGNFEAMFATVSENGRVAYLISGSPSRASDPFQALVTSSIEVEPYYYLHTTDTLTVERVAGARP
jgi:hypothetical protein